MDTKFRNSFFPGLIYWNHNRIHLGTFKKLVFAPMVPPIYIYSNFFGSYQLNDKYITQTHIQQLNISLHFSSLLTLTSIIN